MSLTPAEAALRRELEFDGATPFEIAAVLLACREVSVIELGRDSYLHEMRGKGGKWTRSPVGSSGSVNAAEGRRLQKRAISTKKIANEQFVADVADTAASGHAQAVLEQAKAHVAKAVDDYDKASDAEDKKAHKTALAWHAGLIAAGGVVAAIEARWGIVGLHGYVSDVATIASGLTPALVQEIIDYKKDL